MHKKNFFVSFWETCGQNHKERWSGHIVSKNKRKIVTFIFNNLFWPRTNLRLFIATSKILQWWIPYVSIHPATNVIVCTRFRLKQMWWLTKAMTEIKCEHWTKRWNWSSCTKLALNATWTHGLISQPVRASEWNSVVVGSSPTQVNFL